MPRFKFRSQEYDVKPKLIPSFAALLLFGVLVSLGFWQLDRADEKRVIDQDVLSAIAQQPLDLNLTDSKQLEKKSYRKITVSGEFLAEKQFLLDNRTHKGVPGYHVITPFVFADNFRSNTILVNRGWIQYKGTRDNIPDISINSDSRTLQGSIKTIGESIVLKKDDSLTTNKTTNPILIQSIDIEAIEANLGKKVIPVLVEMDKTDKDGFVREWQPYYGSIDKHLAYATQWFAMAAVLVVLYFSLSTSKTETISDT